MLGPEVSYLCWSCCVTLAFSESVSLSLENLDSHRVFILSSECLTHLPFVRYPQVTVLLDCTSLQHSHFSHLYFFHVLRWLHFLNYFLGFVFWQWFLYRPSANMPSCLFQPLSRSTGCLQVQKPSAVPIEQVGPSSHPSASPETQLHWSATVPQQVFLLQKLLALFVCCCLLSSSLVIFIYLLLF